MEKIKNLFHKKSKKNVLYTAYIKKSFEHVSEIVNEEKLKEQIIQDKKKSKKEIKPIIKQGSIIIPICSLETGTGCNHFSIALANHLNKQYSKELICHIVNRQKDTKTYINKDIECLYWESGIIAEKSSNYRFMVLDLGNINELEELQYQELKRATIKIMICCPEERYLKKLADFIKNETSVKEWIFLFNFVPKGREKNIYDLMEDYRTFCIPLYDKGNFREVSKIFKKLI